jgi:glucose-6-phosphate isomerase
MEKNMPVILALLGVWYTNFFNTRSHTVLPYSHYLRYFPRYLQALEMESNGKSTDRRGRPTAYQTAPVVWGDVGTDGQHAFFQALHQGTQLIPCDFIGFLHSLHQDRQPHQQLLANLIAQAESLAVGTPGGEPGQQEQQPFRRFPGNRPSSMLLIDQLTPLSLGKLIALYEHKVFCQGVIWNIYSFDQWGVELGKRMAGQIESDMNESGPLTSSRHDSSTHRLIQWVGGRTTPPVEPEKEK